MSATPALHEPFETLERQTNAARFGMWIFLASEILFFGSLVLGLTVYRFLNPGAVAAAARETNVVLGSLNTFVLLSSSLTMALADKAAERNLKRLLLACLGLTATLGLAFLAVKGFEYREDIRQGLVPGADFKLKTPQAQIFFSFYWVMTALHATHLAIGIGAVLLVFERARRGVMPFSKTAALPVLALYWHLVDIVWIFLFPLLYLEGRA